ncbi:MAG: SMC-Scp complex subunit ScpB [Oscillospiraceae bacterium]|nr:SMC-Scp complex subunit ScpB [Oscillospiraceae bacterium]
MGIHEIKSGIQAVLFAAGEPMEGSRLAKLFSVNTAVIDNLIDTINDDYEKLPFQIVKLGDCYQMVSRPEHADIIRQALEAKHNAPLSQAAMEVLAIIAYNQPVTRNFIEQVRGIDSSSVVSSLVAKGLVAEAGRLEIPGRPIAYETTAAFLRCFGMKDIEALPKIPQREMEEVE